MATSRIKTSSILQGFPKSRSLLAGNAASPPSSPVAGYKLWLDATDSATITASGGAVSQWNDKSGNAYHFTQATGANQPTTNSRTINSKNVIDFDGTNDFMSVASSTSLFKYLHNSTGGTTFIVGIVDDSGVNKGLFSTSEFASAQIGVAHITNGNEKTETAIVNGNSGNATAVSFDTNILTPASAFYLVNKFDGGNATAGNRIRESLNNGAFAGANTLTNTASSSNSTNNLTLGAAGGGSGTFWNGVIGEFIIYEGILSNGDIDLVETYLAAKWGI